MINRRFFRRLRSPLALTIVATTALSGAIAVSAAQTAAPVPPVTASAITPAQANFFESKIRPILTAQCIPCHGPTAQTAGVRLDTAGGVRKILSAADPDHSRLIEVMTYKDDTKMPPTGKRPESEMILLRQWIKDGAPWPDKAAQTSPAPDVRAKWWSFQPVQRPVVPPVKNKAWAASAADCFVLAGLEAKKLAPAPAADKRTLIRRAYFDLTGLPPTPEAVETFVKDTSPNAFARVVDGLLQSPHFGERWARHWLDVARYADSNGLDENKAFGNAWRYRDWVVSAMNRDLPYNLFVQEQIAGDLMPSPSPEEQNSRITATGFLTLGAKVLAEPDKPKLAMDIVDEQIEVTTKSVMGLTVACARCHDHKFDPITTRDYYALAGIFKSTKTMKSLATVASVNQRVLMTPALDMALKAHAAQMKPLEANVKTARAQADLEVSNGIRARADQYFRAGFALSRQPGVLLSVSDAPVKPGDTSRLLIEAVKFNRGNAVRDTDNYGKGLGVIVTDRAPVSAEWDIILPAAGTYQVELRYAAEEARPVSLLLDKKILRKDAANSVTGSWMPEGQRWEVQGVYKFKAGLNRLKIERTDGPLPHISRILIAPVPAPSTMGKGKTAEEIAKTDNLIPSLVTRWASRFVGIEDPESVRAQLMADPALFTAPGSVDAFYSPQAMQAVKTATDALEEKRRQAPQVPTVLAVEETKTPEDVRVHVRGDTQNLGDTVARGFPTILASDRTIVRPNLQGSGRLELARWITRPQHPLTARVAVNRVWQHLFGAGLVRTPDNWGLKGEKPTNPQLLDYLAATFVSEDGWSQKKLIRRLMLSSAYRMGVPSPIQAKAALMDPENTLLWHQNRRRLEAEPLRDAILAVSGTLDTALGGSLMTTSDNDYVTNDQSKDKAAYDSPRRTLYLPVIRNSLFDLFQAFDFGDGSTVNPHRATTTVAPQSLYLMNSPLVRESSRAFANALLKENVTDVGRVRLAYAKAFARPATAPEVEQATQFLVRYATVLAAHEPDAAKRRERAWQSLCQALFASNEFLYLN